MLIQEQMIFFVGFQIKKILPWRDTEKVVQQETTNSQLQFNSHVLHTYMYMILKIKTV